MLSPVKAENFCRLDDKFSTVYPVLLINAESMPTYKKPDDLIKKPSQRRPKRGRKNQAKNRWIRLPADLNNGLGQGIRGFDSFRIRLEVTLCGNQINQLLSQVHIGTFDRTSSN